VRVVLISGYFNPIHTGHLDYIKAASKLGDKLVVIVNNDKQVELKGSKPFMNEFDRMRIVSAVKGVDKATLSIDEGESVVETLKAIYNEYAVDYFFDSMTFCNGGDRTKGNSPEEQYCEWRGIKTVYNVGGGKTQSSSSLLKESPYHNYEF
jgi:cytidyltransferase-like protein